MFSIQQCKRYLKNLQYSEQQIEDIRHGLYQVAHVLVDNYLKEGRVIDIDKETEAYRGNILVDRVRTENERNVIVSKAIKIFTDELEG